ncbi:MAG: MFS transporter [Galactobacter sp.]
MPTRDSVTAVPAFRGLWLATAAGDAARQVALFATSVILTVTVGASALEVGLASPLSNAGALIFGLVAGTFVDRWGSRRTLIGGVWVRFIAYAIPLMAWWMGWLAGWQLLACVLLASIADTFYSAAHSAVLPAVVGRARVADGSARLQATDQVIWLLGPSLAGALVKWVAAPMLLVASAVGQLVAAAGLRRIPRDQPAPATQQPEGFRESVRTGLRFLVRSRWIGAIALAASLNNAAAGFLGASEAVFLLRDLGFSTLAYGVVTAVSGVGGILGAVITTRLGRAWGPFRTLLTGACMMPLFFALLPLSGVALQLGYGWAIGCASLSMFGFGLCIGLFGVSSAGLTARLTPKRLLARVSSTRRTFTQGAVVVGGLLGALAAQTFGATVPLVIAVAVSATQLIPLSLATRRS